MSDLKADNLMVQVAADGRFQDCTVLDVGGSAAFSGQSSSPGFCFVCSSLCGILLYLSCC